MPIGDFAEGDEVMVTRQSTAVADQKAPSEEVWKRLQSRSATPSPVFGTSR